MQKQASSISDIGIRTEVIELPEPGPNGPMFIELYVRSAAEIQALIGEFQMDVEESPKDVQSVAREMAIIRSKSRPRLAHIAQDVIAAPPFSFEKREEGKAFWGDLSWVNQLAIFSSALRLAGLRAEVKEGTDAASARRVARFPHDAKGEKVRPRTRGGRKAAR